MTSRPGCSTAMIGDSSAGDGLLAGNFTASETVLTPARRTSVASAMDDEREGIVGRIGCGFTPGIDPGSRILGRLTDAAAGLSHRLTGEVWIGDEGRIHRVSWTRIVVRRARWPFKAPQHRLWQTTELWDFGVAVDIEIPSPQPEEKIRIGEVVEAIGSLWRRKRAYERRTKSR